MGGRDQPGTVRDAALGAASLLLGAATVLRRGLHAARLLPTAVLPAPVVSVGNLAAGGTGKTPLVEHLVEVLRGLGARPVVLSRGYGPKAGGSGLNDEGLLLAANLPDLAQRQGPDRAASGRAALAVGEGDCLLLDDGFQHFRLARDLDVVALDARNPFRGGLRREGRGGLRRAGAVVLTRAARAGPERVRAAREEVRRLAPEAAVAVADHETVTVRSLGGAVERAAESLRGERVAAAAGIADPESFREGLEALGAEVAAVAWFPDHGLASPVDLAAVVARARAAGAARVVVTQKDAVKLEAAGAGTASLPVEVLRVRLRVREGAADLEAALREALARGRRRAEEAS